MTTKLDTSPARLRELAEALSGIRSPYVSSACMMLFAIAAEKEAQTSVHEGTRTLILECQAALAEELAAWDIDPPLHHVKQAHDRCTAWLEPNVKNQ